MIGKSDGHDPLGLRGDCGAAILMLDGDRKAASVPGALVGCAAATGALMGALGDSAVAGAVVGAVAADALVGSGAVAWPPQADNRASTMNAIDVR